MAIDLIDPAGAQDHRTLSGSDCAMANQTILLFHGLGGDGNTMLPVGAYCSKYMPNAAFIPVEGPINLGSGDSRCLGWFVPPDDDDRALEDPNPPRFKGLQRSVALVHRKIDGLVGQGTDPSKIHLLGHSQGGAIAISAGLTYPRKLGGVCAIAGYLALTGDMIPASLGTSFHLHHSTHDDNVGYRWVGYARSYLERLGISCTVHTWDIRDDPHAIHDEQLEAICETISNGTPSVE